MDATCIAEYEAYQFGGHTQTKSETVSMSSLIILMQALKYKIKTILHQIKVKVMD